METTNVNIKNWKSLIKPKKLDVQLSNDKSYAKIIAEPLEKGYGLTLGNSLRRILLSSIRGTAVTAVQIDGVLHEFSSIKGVREDVTDIVLNVKSLALKLNSDQPKKMVLKASGPGEIKASQIETGSEIEIINPDLILCHIEKSAKVNVEFTVQNITSSMQQTDNKVMASNITGIKGGTLMYHTLHQQHVERNSFQSDKFHSDESDGYTTVIRKRRNNYSKGKGKQ